MRRKVLIGLLVGFLWTTGIFFGTTLPTPKIAHDAKKITLTEMEKKHENRAIAQTYARIGFGWQGREWKCLESLWTRESRFDAKADNPRSSARGVAQLLGETSSDVRIQVLRGDNYILRRYKTPCNALRHSDKRGWY